MGEQVSSVLERHVLSCPFCNRVQMYCCTAELCNHRKHPIEVRPAPPPSPRGRGEGLTAGLQVGRRAGLAGLLASRWWALTCGRCAFADFAASTAMLGAGSWARRSACAAMSSAVRVREHDDVVSREQLVTKKCCQND